MKKLTTLMLLGLTIGVLLLAGCQGDNGNDDDNDLDLNNTEPPVSTNGDDDNESEEPEITTLNVTLEDEDLILEQDTVKAGRIKFVVTNEGLYNEFRVEGNGAQMDISNGVPAGKTKTLITQLAAGTYKLYSPIPTKEEQGVVAELTVTE